MLVLTPNQRAARELALALHRAVSGDSGAALIAPDIRALGDIGEEDDLASLTPDALALPPALSQARRRGALTKLIQAWRTHQDGRPWPPASALAAADELAGLLDQAALSGGVDWSQLDEEALPPDLSEHWRLSASFLAIVAEAWPAHLAEHNAIDGQTRRLLAAQALADRWAVTPPDHPVVIAGSTGSGAATRILMRAVMNLPRGLVVLPGLDTDLDAAAVRAIREAASHPQHTLLDTLRDLGVAPSSVTLWPGLEETSAQRARRRLLNEALAPAEETQSWTTRLADLASPASPADFVNEGLSGLRLVEAADENEEALTAALLLREALEHDNRTAALVTPEAGLARRVSAILARWNIDVAPSVGLPLARTPACGLVLLGLRWMLDPGDPVMLLAILKHRLAGFGHDRDRLAAITSTLERNMLHGPRRYRDLAGLVRLIEREQAKANDNEDAAAADRRRRRLDLAVQLVRAADAVAQTAQPVASAEMIDGDAAARAAAALVMAIAATPDSPTGAHVWAGRDGAMAARFLEQLAETCAEAGPMPAYALPGFAEALASTLTAPPETPGHPRLAIWGPLEARLQRRDRMILAGLNEGVWPRPSATDAFLNRQMRQRLGLPDPDERIGLSAHDFAQFANAAETILLRAKRMDDRPAVASRWVWRLRTLAAGGLGGRQQAEDTLAARDTDNPLHWARGLRASPPLRQAQPPAPRPEVKVRSLQKFSPSRVTQLIRDPYADYARYILQLKRLRRPGEAMDARERGTAVHNAVEAFAKDPLLDLDALIAAELEEAGAPAEIIALERPLWLRAAKVYCAWLDGRADNVRAFDVEQKAAVILTTRNGEVKLEAKADRIEQLRDGTLAIIDVKTGQPRSASQVLSGFEPQLPLEAVIAAQTAFGNIPPASTSELIYFRLSTSGATEKKKNGAPLEFETPDKQPVSVAEVIQRTREGFIRLVESYNDPAMAYRSRPRVFSVRFVSDYDRLARRGEWDSAEGEE